MKVNGITYGKRITQDIMDYQYNGGLECDDLDDIKNFYYGISDESTYKKLGKLYGGF